MDVSTLTDLIGSEAIAKVIIVIVHAFALVGYFNIFTAFLLAIEKMDEKGLSKRWFNAFIALPVIGFVAIQFI